MQDYKGINNELLDNKLFQEIPKSFVIDTYIQVVGESTPKDTKKYLVYHLIERAKAIYGDDNVQVMENHDIQEIIGIWNNTNREFENSKIDKSKKVHIFYIPQSESTLGDRGSASAIKSFRTIENNARHIKPEGRVFFIFTTRANLHVDVRRCMNFIIYHDIPHRLDIVEQGRLLKYFPIELKADYHYFVNLYFGLSCGYKIDVAEISFKKNVLIYLKNNKHTVQ